MLFPMWSDLQLFFLEILTPALCGFLFASLNVIENNLEKLSTIERVGGVGDEELASGQDGLHLEPPWHAQHQSDVRHYRK